MLATTLATSDAVTGEVLPSQCPRAMPRLARSRHGWDGRPVNLRTAKFANCSIYELRGLRTQFPTSPLIARQTRYFGIGSMTIASSGNDASLTLPLMRYCTFNCFTVPGTGSPPKLAL